MVPGSAARDDRCMDTTPTTAGIPLTLDEMLEGRSMRDVTHLRRAIQATMPPPGPRDHDVAVLIGDLNGHLVAPMSFRDLPSPCDPAHVRVLLEAVAEVVGEHATVATLLVRPGPAHAIAADRAWQEVAQRCWQEKGVIDLGCFVVGTHGVDLLPRLELVA